MSVVRLRPGERGQAVHSLRYVAGMPERRPLAVLVGGAPGSGKTTIAEVLAAGLDLPALHKDRLVHGRWRTLDRATELGESGVEPFFRSMELWIEAGISFVAEQTFYPEVSESDVARRLAPRSTLVNVHCRSVHSFERWEQRMRDDPLCGDLRRNRLVPVVERLTSQLHEPLDFDCPSVVVNTDNGYQPTLEEVITQIDDLYSRPDVHDLDRASELAE
jgi:chloramphenicol 3-O-phosphotransferase